MCRSYFIHIAILLFLLLYYYYVVYTLTPTLLLSHFIGCLMQTGGKDYHRLTCDQPVGLRHARCFLTVQDVVKVRC